MTPHDLINAHLIILYRNYYSCMVSSFQHTQLKLPTLGSPSVFAHKRTVNSFLGEEFVGAQFFGVPYTHKLTSQQITVSNA